MRTILPDELGTVSEHLKSWQVSMYTRLGLYHCCPCMKDEGDGAATIPPVMEICNSPGPGYPLPITAVSILRSFT